jgi:hypothetical protein
MANNLFTFQFEFGSNLNFQNSIGIMINIPLINNNRGFRNLDNIDI